MKRVLLIGISDYKVFTNEQSAPPLTDYWPRLEGAVHDIEAFKGNFRDLGFQIVTLINAQATGEEIRKGFKKIVEETKVKIFLILIHILLM